MKYVGKFYVHLVYLTVILYILWPFGIFCGHFGIFFRFSMLYQEKSGNPEIDCIERMKWLVLLADPEN
jgi:hypothetical protein